MNEPKSDSTQQENFTPTGRTRFVTGAVRDEKVAGDNQKFPMRFDLLISNTDFMRRLAATYGEGSAKYGDDNWRNGMPEKSLFNHCLAHLMQHLDGDTSDDHLAHAVWNLITLMWVQVNMPHLMDLTALVAKGKLQPCNIMAGEPKKAPPMLEPNLMLREAFGEMAQQLRRAEVAWAPPVQQLITKAMIGEVLSNDEVSQLRDLHYGHFDLNR